MIVPSYWGEASVRAQVRGRQVTLRRFGWSDASGAQAQAMAEERAAAALARLEAGEQVARREPRVPYNGAEGVPIREEVVARHGDAVITRNSYGALCLNTPDVLFADIDFEEAPSARLLAVAFLIGALPALAAGAWTQSSMLRIGLGIGALACAYPVAKVLLRIWSALRGDAEHRAMRRIERHAATDVTARLRVYRTPAGLRVLAMHRTFEPAGPEATALFHALATDPIYVRMCKRQHCFRARVSPKPWRAGIEDHMKPRPGTWPVAPERLDRRRQWIANYEAKTRSFAACRFVKEFGNGSADDRAQLVRALHDKLSKAMGQLPIA